MVKELIKGLLNRVGYNIVRINGKYGIDPYADMSRLIDKDQSMIFDVGANVGQTIHKFRQYIGHGTIHGFEPNPGTFEILRANASSLSRVNLWQTGLGSSIGPTTFFENSESTMSSFLRLGEMGWGSEKQTTAQVTTIDQFCTEQKIDAIDILKIDTQGFELEILKGAQGMLSNNSIGLVYLEVTFSELYQNLPSVGDLFNFLSKKGFKLVSIYKMFYRDNLAAWTDLLFIHKDYKEK